MLQVVAFPLAFAVLAAAQYTAPTPINPETLSPILPSVTVNTSALTSTAATIDATATTLACLPESDLIFSIQTDTVLGNEPASTPTCGQTTSILPAAPLANLTTTTATTAATTNATVLRTTDTLTTSASATTSAEAAGSETSAPAHTQSGSSAATIAAGGGVAGAFGLAAGVGFLLMYAS